MVSFLSYFRGSNRQHAIKGSHVNKGEPSGFRQRPEAWMEVRLVDSTLRLGEPITWGSDQQEMNCSWET